MKYRPLLHLLTCTGALISTITLYSLNLAMVVMIKQRPFNELEINSNECHSIEKIIEINKNIIIETETLNVGGLHRSVFEWDGLEQGLVLGAIFWLKWLAIPLSSGLARRFGAKVTYGCTNLFASFLFFIAPMALYFDVEWLLLVRVVQGLLLAIASSCPHVIAEQWWPANERRKKSTTAIWIGEITAVAISYPVFGLIMHVSRWDDVVYVSGWIGIVWAVLWYLFAFDSPGDHPRINAGEKEKIEMIVSGNTNEDVEYITPWLHLFTSWQVWLGAVVEFCFSILDGATIIYLPLFLGLIHRTNILTTALYIGLPFFLRLITCWIAVTISNRFASSENSCRTQNSKTFNNCSYCHPRSLVPGTCPFHL